MLFCVIFTAFLCVHSSHFMHCIGAHPRPLHIHSSYYRKSDFCVKFRVQTGIAVLIKNKVFVKKKTIL